MDCTRCPSSPRVLQSGDLSRPALITSKQLLTPYNFILHAGTQVASKLFSACRGKERICHKK